MSGCGKLMGELVSAPCINGGRTLSWETFVRDSTNTVIVVQQEVCVFTDSGLVRK